MTHESSHVIVTQKIKAAAAWVATQVKKPLGSFVAGCIIGAVAALVF